MVVMNKIVINCLFLVPSIALAYTSPGSPQGHLNDFTNTLSAEAKSSLEQSLISYEQASGHQIAVAIIPELKDETIETYAFKLFKEWGIGQKGKNNGVLFLISIKDREMKIEVGYGLEGALTDIEAGNIVDNIVPPYFKAGDYAGGIKAGLDGIIQAIGGTLEPSSPSFTKEGVRGWSGNYFWVVIGLFMWLTSVLARSRSWWLGGVIGAVAGGIIWLVWSMIFTLPILVLGGLLLDYIVSKKYKQAAATGNFHGLWWMGGGKHPWDKGGGWGGFGGGMSGGGGASGRW